MPSKALDNVFKLRDIVSLKEPAYGAKGDGTTNDTTAVTNWIAAAAAAGAIAFGAPGTYAMTPISHTMTDDVEIECARGCEFKYFSAQSSPLFTFTAATRDLYSLKWQGGIIDNSGGEFTSADQSNTCLALTRVSNFEIDGVTFRGEATYDLANDATTGTDSGITLVDGKRGSVTNCVFIGQGDAGIYFSGNSSEASVDDDGGDIVITGNHFTQCDQAVTMKRNIRGAVIANNTVRNCRLGMSALDVTDISPGRQLIVANNSFKFIETRAVEIRQHDGSIVIGNVIEDFGYQPDGSTISSIPHAIRILGTSGAIVAHNQVRNREWAIHANHRGVSIETATINAVLYTPSNNIIQGNQFDEVTSGILEGASVGVNYYLDNVFDASVTTPYTLTNANSFVRWINAGQSWEQYANVGNVGTGADTLNTITLPAGVLNFSGTGRTRRLEIKAWGSTANNTNTKQIELLVNSTVVLTTALTVSQSGRWSISADLVRTGTDTQKVDATLIQGGTTTLLDCESSSLTEDDGAAMTISLRGTVTDGGGGVNNNDIINGFLGVKLVN